MLFKLGQKVLVTGEYNLYKGLIGMVVKVSVEDVLVYFKNIDRKAYIKVQELKIL